MAQLRPKITCPHNSGSAVRIVLKYRKMKGAKRDMEIVLMVFLKKIIWGNPVILAQKWCVFLTLDLFQVVFFF